jgi:hypothetical protein
MPDYQLSKVYQIVCLTTGQKYIGSTTQATLAVRLAGHVKSFKCWKNGKYHFVSSFAVLEQDNYQIELLEAYPCNSKDELNAREGQYIRMVDCVNKCVMGRTKKEWRETNKTDIAEKKKEIYEDNKSEILEKAKELYKANKTEVLEKNKSYYDANKDKISEQRKQYREKNKVKIAEQKKAYYIKKKAESQ